MLGVEMLVSISQIKLHFCNIVGCSIHLCGCFHRSGAGCKEDEHGGKRFGDDHWQNMRDYNRR